jgi:hypothetical protein
MEKDKPVLINSALSSIMSLFPCSIVHGLQEIQKEGSCKDK